MISISHIPCYCGNSVVMATRVKFGNKQHSGLLSAGRSRVPNTTLEEVQMAELQAYVSVAMVTTFQ